ncbi:MAG: NAD-dependent epimerase/dehydratase family protein [Actinomycetota bacterium]
MRAFVTGATGFIGGHFVRRLRARGDDVVALVRSPDRAETLRDAGVELVEGDASDPAAVRRAADGCDAAFHLAGMYRVGIRPRERPAMYQANVRSTEVVLDAAAEAGVPRILYVSTCNVFGNTRGRIVDEAYERPAADGFLSYYDETKYLAHLAAAERIAHDVPIVIVQPGAVYGRDDHSEVGWMIDQLRKGRLWFRLFPELGMTFVHVDDVAGGIVLAYEGGVSGQSYILGGEVARMGEVVDRAAAIIGRRPPRLAVPPRVVRMSAPLGPIAARLLGTPANLSEAVRAAHGVTYWATDAKARRELGYAPRSLDVGLRETLSG